jgi:PiT family inorganic phosphate transporter
MEIIAVYGTAMVVTAIIFGLFMTWGVGANDLANAMGTSVCDSAPAGYFTKHREN